MRCPSHNRFTYGGFFLLPIFNGLLKLFLCMHYNSSRRTLSEGANYGSQEEEAHIGFGANLSA